MPQDIYEVEINGQVYEVEAPSLRAAITATKRMGGTPPPAAATAGMLPQSTDQGDPIPRPSPASDDIRGALRWGGNVIAGMTGMGQAGRDLVSNAEHHPVQTAVELTAGAAIPPVLRSTRKIFTQRMPERFYGQIFKSAPDDIRARFTSLAKGGPENPTLAKEMLVRGVSGSSEQMAVESYKRLEAMEQQLQSAATGQAVSLSPNKPKYISLLTKIKDTFDNTFFSQRAEEADDLIRALNTARGGAVSASDALRLKRFLDRMRNTSSFRSDPRLTVAQEELKVAADTVRTTLRQNPVFADLLNEERVYIQAFDDIVDDAVRRNNKQLLGLTDYILGGGGVVAGADFAGVGAAGAVRAFQQPRTLTGLGQMAYRAGQAVPRGSGQKAVSGAVAASVGTPKADRRD